MLNAIARQEARELKNDYIALFFLKISAFLSKYFLNTKLTIILNADALKKIYYLRMGY